MMSEQICQREDGHVEMPLTVRSSCVSMPIIRAGFPAGFHLFWGGGVEGLWGGGVA